MSSLIQLGNEGITTILLFVHDNLKTYVKYSERSVQYN